MNQHNRKGDKMSHTIRGFQEDKALLLADDIAKKTGESIAVTRIHALMVTHGIVSDPTYWARVEKVLNDLGFDYDEIFEVA